MRALTGKNARLSSVDFDKRSVNDIPEPVVNEEVVAEDAKTE
jgi:hypothetical protein